MGCFIILKPSGGRCLCPANSPAGLTSLCFMPKPVGGCGASGAAAQTPAWELPGEVHPKGNTGPAKGMRLPPLLPGPSTAWSSQGETTEMWQLEGESWASPSVYLTAHNKAARVFGVNMSLHSAFHMVTFQWAFRPHTWLTTYRWWLCTRLWGQAGLMLLDFSFPSAHQPQACPMSPWWQDPLPCVAEAAEDSGDSGLSGISSH